jgi:hypothetical protein
VVERQELAPQNCQIKIAAAPQWLRVPYQMEVHGGTIVEVPERIESKDQFLERALSISLYVPQIFAENDGFRRLPFVEG